MDILCFYHSADLDGYTSGMLVNAFESISGNNISLQGWNYSDDVPDMSDLKKYDAIYLVDLSFPDDLMLKLKKEFGDAFIWIDHHFNVISRLEEKFGKNYFEGIQNIDNATIYNVYEYFTRHGLKDKYLQLLNDYDSWHNSDKEYWENEVMPYQFYMRSFIHSADDMIKYVSSNDYDLDSNISKDINIGKTLYDYQKNLYLSQLKNAYYTTFEGYDIVALNTQDRGSSIFDNISSVIPNKKSDIMGVYYFKDGMYYYSLYSTSDIDVSSIAKKYGGGGHKGAAGFQSEKKLF